MGDLVPDGFERYGRLLHPAWHREEGFVRWSLVAEWSGRELHPAVRFDDLARPLEGPKWGAVGEAPGEGELDRSVVAHLAGVLADSSSTPDASWYCVWSGYGGLAGQVEVARWFIA